MAFVIETPNPFEPFKVQKHFVEGGLTIWEWLQQRHPGFTEFKMPTICILNGKPLKREGWGNRIESGDIINFVTLPQGPEIWLPIVAIVIGLAAAAVTLLMPVSTAPTTPGEQPKSDPVFSTKGQNNSIRLGEPIEVCYGRNRMYPSLASRPYFQYEDNDQFQYSLFCLGHGEFDVEEIKIGDTDIDNFQEVEYEIVPPSAQVTLFPTNVWTVAEAGGQTLYGPNEDEYTGDGWVGPFAANPADTETTELQVDLVFPKGLYRVLDDGSLEERTVQVQVQVRPIDGAGAPTGPYVNLFAEKRVVTYVSTKHTRNVYRDQQDQQGLLYVHITWTWEQTDVEILPVESGDPPAGTITTEYSDSNPSDDPANREGVIKTVETILTESSEFTIAGATTTPIRKSFSSPIAAGRYEMRMRRINDTDLSHRAGHEVTWGGLRAILTDEPDFGPVTLLAVIIRATNNLNERTQQAFNVLATRKLPIWESGGGFNAVPVATRSIVWAFVDIFRSHYGGRVAEDYFDFDALEELDALYTSRGEYFDWVFRDPITVWEAARAVARAGRAVPMLVGSQITMRRDGPEEVPVTLFSPDNITRGSLRWDVKLWDLDEQDGIRVEYTEPSTGYKQEQVTAILPGDTGNNIKNLRLIGVQNRNQAYRAGLHMMALLRHVRENITFETGLEGHIPSYGSLIAVSHDMPQWGQSGYVVHAVKRPGANDDYHLWVSEPLEFTSGQQHQVLLRGSKGEVIGPLNAEETDDPKRILVEIPGGTDFFLTGETEPMLFLFGISNEVSKLCRVVQVVPQGKESIKIVAVNDAPIIHTFDELEAPALSAPSTPPQAPDLPEIDEVRISQVDGPLRIIQISWSAAFGALRYIVQTSQDGVNWAIGADTPRSSVQLQVRPGELHVRVAAINRGQGPWETAQIVIGLLQSVEVHVPWDHKTEWGIRWWEVLNVTLYQIKVYDNSGGSPVLKRTTTQEGRIFTYDIDMATADSNVVREMLVEVDIMIENVETEELEPSGSPVEQELTNSIATAPQNPGSVLDSVETDEVLYEVSWDAPTEDDLVRIKVWVSETNGFDPGVDIPVINDVFSAGAGNAPLSKIVAVALDSAGEHPTMYWRAAFFDAWGNELTTNITAEQTIPAYP